MALFSKKPKKSVLRDYSELAVWIILLFSVRSLLAQNFFVPSESMMPTALVGDVIVATKYDYGYNKYSMPLDVNLGSYNRKDPNRGDIVVFRFTKNTNITYLKRVIGLPGDHIQVINGSLFINSKKIDEIKKSPALIPYTNRDSNGNMLSNSEYKHGHIFIETLPNGVKHSILKLDEILPDMPSVEFANNTPQYIVPKGYYFMMGDDRDNSLDSRFQDSDNESLGFVPQANLVGKARFVLWSFDWKYPVWEFWHWPYEVRWNRFFKELNT